MGRATRPDYLVVDYWDNGDPGGNVHIIVVGEQGDDLKGRLIIDDVYLTDHFEFTLQQTEM